MSGRMSLSETIVGGANGADVTTGAAITGAAITGVSAGGGETCAGPGAVTGVGMTPATDALTAVAGRDAAVGEDVLFRDVTGSGTDSAVVRGAELFNERGSNPPSALSSCFTLGAEGAGAGTVSIAS